jgi:hypothetical protein
MGSTWDEYQAAIAKEKRKQALQEAATGETRRHRLDRAKVVPDIPIVDPHQPPHWVKDIDFQQQQEVHEAIKEQQAKDHLHELLFGEKQRVRKSQLRNKRFWKQGDDK